MKNAVAEPPGRLYQPKAAFPLPVFQSPGFTEGAPFASVEALVAQARPETPVHCLRPQVIESTARWFLKHFPGEVMFSVKSNPDPRVLGYLSRAGVRHFDVASLAEISQMAELAPEAKLHFMHPVKSRESIRRAYYEFGIRDFSLDSHEELQKILEVTAHAGDLALYVRLAIPNDQAAYSLCGKFGVPLEQAASLLAASRAASARLGVCFHVGSQCMNPAAYGVAIAMVDDLLTQTDARLDILDIGGGFPSVYPGMTPPPLMSYMRAIKKALKAHPRLASARLVCEPGRALVAEGGSLITRVELRKGNMLHINDGIYGSLFDAGWPGFVYPVKAMRPGGRLSKVVAPFGLFGPTCDSMDAMKGPFHLPEDIGEGDWIEIGQMGAYGATMRTRFNGFYSDKVAEVLDKPLMSIFRMN